METDSRSAPDTTKLQAEMHDRDLNILGVTFVGTGTSRRPEMVQFLDQVLGLSRLQADDVEADLFALADGSTFAVSSPGGMGETQKSIGFLVADLEDAVTVLKAAGVTVGDIATNSLFRYAHFVAPDGQLYELVERVTA